MKVSDSLAKDIEIAAQKCVIYELQVQSEHAKLIAARDALVQQARAEVDAPEGHVYDTETHEFRAKNEPMTIPRLMAESRQVRRARARKGSA